MLARSLPKALLAAFFIVFLALAAPVAAAEEEAPVSPVIAQVPSESAQPGPYEETHGTSPLDNIPVAPMIGGTAGTLVLLSVVALRREWI